MGSSSYLWASASSRTFAAEIIASSHLPPGIASDEAPPRALLIQDFAKLRQIVRRQMRLEALKQSIVVDLGSLVQHQYVSLAAGSRSSAVARRVDSSAPANPSAAASRTRIATDEHAGERGSALRTPGVGSPVLGQKLHRAMECCFQLARFTRRQIGKKLLRAHKRRVL